jgi:hypothetical protein
MQTYWCRIYVIKLIIGHRALVTLDIECLSFNARIIFNSNLNFVRWHGDEIVQPFGKNNGVYRDECRRARWR